MDKDFDGWNEQKKQIHARNDGIYFHEREVWWCSLGVNIGFEQDGKNELFERPVLVVKKFNREVLWAVPLTRTDKRNVYYFPVSVGEQNSAVVLSQLRLISSKRLQRRMHKLPKGQFKRVVKALQQFFPRS
jgi:mRNA interferase MazF